MFIDIVSLHTLDSNLFGTVLFIINHTTWISYLFKYTTIINNVPSRGF